MKVRELRERLEALRNVSDDADVILSIDEEGNGFRVLTDVQESAIRRDGSEVEAIHFDDEEGDEERAVVLWP